MEEITSLWDRLSLTTKEVDRVDLSGTHGLTGGLLAAKFLTKRVLNMEAVMRTLKPLWRAARGFKGRDMGSNGILFIFNDATDMERVLANEPWSFDKYLILLKRIEDDQSFSQDAWVSLKYERLPTFCYWCGIISHGDRDCEVWLKSRGTLSSESQQYGPWMRGEVIRSFRRMGDDFRGPPPFNHMPAPRGGGAKGWQNGRAHKDNADFPQPSKVVTPTRIFEDQLREIDKDLGLDSGESNVPLTSVQNSNMGSVRRVNDVVGQVGEAGPADIGLVMGCKEQFPISSKSSRPTGGTWKRILREPNGSKHAEPNSQLCYEDIGGGCRATPPEAMSCLFWNCRGLGNPATVQELTIMVRQKDPLALFISETKLDVHKLEILRCYWGFGGKLVVPSRGQSGGLVLFWRRGVSVTVSSYSHHHIDAVVEDDKPQPWRITGFYGSPTSAGQRVAWDILRELSTHHQLPWLCGGDFNELLRGEEKWGRVARSEAQMARFRSVVDDCGFMDLGFSGPQYTWWNKRDGAARVLERLDRCFANAEWLVLFPSCRVHHLHGVFSDHRPLWMELNSVTNSPRPRRKHFRFEEMWTMDPSCEETVRQAWAKTQHGTPMYQVTEKIKTSRADLKEWSFTHFGSVRYLIETKSRQLQSEEALVPEAQNVPLLKKLREELTILFAKEEKMWKQRSRTQWLQSGDRNTRFFHCQATQRRRRNSIQQLRDNDGVWRSSEAEIEQLLVSYYSDLFTTSSPGDFEEVIDGVSKVITGEMNDMLVAEFTASEIELALKQMAPLKAPGPDGRLISDNILIAFETLHHMQHMKGGRLGYMALKLDMSKAYDRVEWEFLEKIMLKMGFHTRWVSIVMECVRTVSYSVLINEGLQALLAHTAQAKKIQGLSISRGGPTLTHLFFADDSVLFCRANLSDCHAIQEYDKYLGLPSLVGRSKNATFAHLKERVWTKMQGWKERLLSQAGREVLIKAVIQAIPTYTMNCFKLPKKLCLELERLIRNFWWGHTESSRKVHWVKWSSLCQPKSMGGMGFRDLAKFNDALLAKQVWRLVHNKTSLLYKVFKAKYFPRSTIMEARFPASASFAWKSICQARHVIRKGARWRVGNGNSIRVWHDRWIPIPSAGELVERIFIPSEASLILSTILSSRAPNDLLVWGGCSTTEYWRLFWKKIWSVKVPFKIRNFLWRVCIDALPTLVKLQRRTIVSTACCSFCQAEDEDIMHALWTCPLLMPLWTRHKLTRKAVRCRYTSLLDVVGHLLEYDSDASLAEFAFMLWLVWQRRNKAMYQSELTNLDDIPLLAQRLLREYWAVNDQQQPVPQVSPKQAWQPPTLLEFKANCDAALFPAHNMTSVGVVIRDGHGLPIATLCKRFHGLHAVDDAEALAVREAVQLARDVGLVEVEVEGDSLLIFNALKQQQECFASYGDIIQDIHQLACSLDRVVFSHVRRTGNRVAHVLARNAIGLSSDFLVWLEDVPPFLADVIQSEFSPI
uniref:Uncharacterized protein n=1 Tax=Fagus sylvatica TaxID=28930 RepID=A0A2N9IFR8_FAGSY